ncbi:MAG: response regulator [Bacteroidales bacterium]|nr:MAG: response regulator [Bacteroidales bacterium]
MNEKQKILIIEDDHDLIEAFSLILKSRKYQIVRAYNTETGVKMIKQEKPDLVILDVMFGSKGKTKGFDLAVKVRQDKSMAKVPILMLTSVNEAYPGFDFSPDTDEEFLPVDEFINKPAQPDELAEKVEKLLKAKTSKWANWPNRKEIDLD